MLYKRMNSVNKQYKNQDQIYYHFQHLSFHMHFVYIPFMINQLLFCFCKAFSQQLFIFPHIIKQQLDNFSKNTQKIFSILPFKMLVRTFTIIPLEAVEPLEFMPSVRITSISLHLYTWYFYT